MSCPGEGDHPLQIRVVGSCAVRRGRIRLLFVVGLFFVVFLLLVVQVTVNGFDRGKESEISCEHNGEGKRGRAACERRVSVSNRLFLLFENSIVCQVC